jgi:hypothetical protein
MANPEGAAESEAVRLDFDRRLTLQFRGSAVTSDAGLLRFRVLDGRAAPLTCVESIICVAVDRPLPASSRRAQRTKRL